MGRINEEAQNIYNRIGDGHRHAVKRPWDMRIDRSLRRLIEHANHNGDCIISGESGYYRPIPSDTLDALEYKSYMLKEHSKIESMRTKEMCMHVAYDSRKVGG